MVNVLNSVLSAEASAISAVNSPGKNHRRDAENAEASAENFKFRTNQTMKLVDSTR
jgi:hypothetical protein